MDLLLVGHVAAFGVAGVVCLAAVPRALEVGHRATREGLVGVLVTAALWSFGYVGYFTMPGDGLKTASYVFGLVAAWFCVGAWLYFAMAYTGRSPKRAPYARVVAAAFVAVAVSKVANPLHGLYFETSYATEPFAHLAVHHGLLHWVVLAASYVVVGVSFFMLLERFYEAGVDARPLVVLVGFTGVPVGLNVLGMTESSLLPLWYEPLGVAVFAVGTLYVYLDRFEAVRFTGDGGATVLLDADGSIRDVGVAAGDLLPGVDEARGKTLAEAVPGLPDSRPDGAVVEVGDGRYVEMSARPTSVRGETTGYVVSVSDVTERERYREALELRTEQLETLNRVIRHDIRNDMTVMIGWLELASEHVDDEAKDAFDRVVRRAHHVVDLTENIRDIVDSLSVEGEVELRPADVVEHLEMEVEATRESNPEATIELDGDLESVEVDANEMLSSVFRNLLTNAVVHSDRESPHVEVSVEVTGDSVRVRVADDGPGVPDDRKTAVFGRGEKGVDSPGTGVGLYLVDRLVDSYGGDVWIEDNEPRGAVFVVELPLATGD
ncbi:MAG: ATP-binding protein [Halobacteriales archaeon]